jgi:hypothetical protein
MIATCPKCSNRYHIDFATTTVEVLMVCPGCGHKWISRRIIEIPKVDENSSQEEKRNSPLLEKFQQNKKIFLMLLFFSLSVGYILHPLIKLGFESLASLLKNHTPPKDLLVIQNIDHFFDEKEKTITISWELKNDMSISKDLKAFRIQLFVKCAKNDGDCLVKEIKFQPNKDIILPKEILRFECSEKCSIPVTKIQIFP